MGKESKSGENWQIPHISIFIYLYFFSRQVEVDSNKPPREPWCFNIVLFKAELRKHNWIQMIWSSIEASVRKTILLPAGLEFLSRTTLSFTPVTQALLQSLSKGHLLTYQVFSSAGLIELLVQPNTVQCKLINVHHFANQKKPHRLTVSGWQRMSRSETVPSAAVAVVTVQLHVSGGLNRCRQVGENFFYLLFNCITAACFPSWLKKTQGGLGLLEVSPCDLKVSCPK